MLNPYPSGRRTLTGAWIETSVVCTFPRRGMSHPHGVRRMNSAVVFNDVCMVREVIILINGFKWLFIEYSFKEDFYVGEDAG